MVKHWFEVLFLPKEPLTKEQFFKYSFVLILLQAFMVWLYYVNNFSLTRPFDFIFVFLLLLIFVEIPFLCAYYMLSSKRIWDITGEKLLSFFLNIILMFVSILLLPLFVVVYVLLLLLPSKKI